MHVEDELTLSALLPSLPACAVLRFVLDHGRDDFLVRASCYAKGGWCEGKSEDQSITAIEVIDLSSPHCKDRLCFCRTRHAGFRVGIEECVEFGER